jgi:glycine/D-amino acid oxidase-like deaminating enzyme
MADAAAIDATSYWLAASAAGPVRPPLVSDDTADIVIVGGGFTGLWTAIALTDTDPTLRVVVLEGATVGYGASGRNGGFCSASLTHGLANGIRHFPDEVAFLEREGVANLRALVAFTREHAIDCDLEETGILDVADQPHQVEEFRAWVDEAAAWGEELEFMDREQIQAEVHSPLWLAAIHRRPGRDALLDPARLVRGLARVCEERGVVIHEGTRVTGVERGAGGVRVGTAGGRSVVAGHVVVATSAYSGWLRRLSAHFVPVYDYVLVSDPLSSEQLASIGWERRQGMSDANNQFHYFRLTADNRILWGGYDAIYHYGGAVRAELERRPATYALLAEHFFTTFPQLAGLRFSHAWGGVIDTCSRFCAFYGTAHGGRLAYAAGYTGLGVGATRFGADVMLDLLSGEETERTRLAMVGSKPVPFPPEPLRYGAVQLTRWSLARADRREGRRNLWLRALDAIGAGFDS